jgi:RNA polymerase sigma-70 factor, ECF subfamily
MGAKGGQGNGCEVESCHVLAQSWTALRRASCREFLSRFGRAEAHNWRSMRSAVSLRLVSSGTPHPGPGSALDQAFRAHAPQVATMALRILGRREEADDLVQDVFMKAGRWLSRLNDPSAVHAWLMKVTVRLAWRRLRMRRWRVALGLDGSYDYAEVAGKGPISPEDGALLAEVYRILDRIPARERLAWSLRHVDGEKLEAVAQHCACSLATAKRWIATAQARLQKEIGHV